MLRMHLIGVAVAGLGRIALIAGMGG